MQYLREFFTTSFGVVVLLVALAIALTVYVFRHRLFDRGYRKGTAADERQVRHENPPDEWSRSH
ncbi:MAG TPA: hypothetical protein VFS24_11260 [Steroidobacteraceae bacterium]|nr:hypothetical protein [Steroidobacteraceae bacterium]